MPTEAKNVGVERMVAIKVVKELVKVSDEPSMAVRRADGVQEMSARPKIMRAKFHAVLQFLPVIHVQRVGEPHLVVAKDLLEDIE
jgi:hypothetical protein